MKNRPQRRIPVESSDKSSPMKGKIKVSTVNVRQAKCGVSHTGTAQLGEWRIYHGVNDFVVVLRLTRLVEVGDVIFDWLFYVPRSFRIYLVSVACVL